MGDNNHEMRQIVQHLQSIDHTLKGILQALKQIATKKD
jgi:hypothetical protein